MAVTATEAAVRGKYQQNRLSSRCPFLEKRMRNLKTRLGEAFDHFRDPLCIRGRRYSSIHRLLESRSGDQFHRSRDFANVAY